MPDSPLTLREVVELTGVNPITLRSWVQRAVLPRGSGYGRATRYTHDHVLRIRAIQKLRDDGYGLMQIAHRVRLMTPEELAAFEPSTPASPTSAAPLASPGSVVPTPSTPIGQLSAPLGSRALEWVPLMPGLALIFDPSGGEVLRRAARDIVAQFGLRPGAGTGPFG